MLDFEGMNEFLADLVFKNPHIAGVSLITREGACGLKDSSPSNHEEYFEAPVQDLVPCISDGSPCLASLDDEGFKLLNSCFFEGETNLGSVVVEVEGKQFRLGQRLDDQENHFIACLCEDGSPSEILEERFSQGLARSDAVLEEGIESNQWRMFVEASRNYLVVVSIEPGMRVDVALEVCKGVAAYFDD